MILAPYFRLARRENLFGTPSSVNNFLIFILLKLYLYRSLIQAMLFKLIPARLHRFKYQKVQ
jgi:hypothetical protein